jgi:hypothetical protein
MDDSYCILYTINRANLSLCVSVFSVRKSRDLTLSHHRTKQFVALQTGKIPSVQQQIVQEDQLLVNLFQNLVLPDRIVFGVA